jgi:hypothetical protein
LIDRYLGVPRLARALDARVMSAGLQVGPEHGVVFAEVLTRITGRSGVRVMLAPLAGPHWTAVPLDTAGRGRCEVDPGRVCPSAAAR